jgi:hypothetical protein
METAEAVPRTGSRLGPVGCDTRNNVLVRPLSLAIR